MSAACAARAAAVAESAVNWDSRFWSKVHPEALSGCWLWHANTTRKGYGMFKVATRKKVQAHRHAYELVRGPIPAGMVVRHKCDVPGCVNPAHLELGTDADNVRDRDERRRQARGEVNGRAKLTSAQVQEIREKYAGGSRTQLSLAAECAVSQRHVSDIIRGKRWSHLRGGGQ